MSKVHRIVNQQKQSSAINQNVANTTIKKQSLLLPLIIVFCIPVLLYVQTLSFGFTHFDDDIIITTNSTFLSDYKNISQAFATDAFMGKHGTFYRPLQTISFMIDSHVSTEKNPWMFHVSNIILLGLIAMVLFLLLKRLLLSVSLALFGALLYCTHPLFVSSIAWIPARGDLMLTFFALLSFLLLVKYISEKKPVLLYMHWVAFTVALFCKETAAFLPFLFVAYFYVFATNKHIDKTQTVVFLLYAVSGVVWFWLRSNATGNISNEAYELGFTAFTSNLPSIIESLSKFILPFDFAPIPAFSIVKIITGAVILGCIIFFSIKNKQRTTKEKLFCLLWFVLLILPPMIYKHPLIDYLDHRFFLPLIGILLLLLFLFPKEWLENAVIKKPWIPIMIIVAFSSITFIKMRAYASPMAFYNEAIAQNPQSSMAYNNRGRIKTDAGDKVGAVDDFNHALAINPNNELAYYNRGLVQTTLGNIPEAINNFNRVIMLNPNNANAYFGRGNAYNAAHNFKEAINDFSRTIAMNADYAEAYNNRGSAESNLGDKHAAIDDYNKAISLLPNYAVAYYNRGNAKSDLLDSRSAIADYTLAIGYNPNYEDAYNNKGIELVKIGNFQEAISTFNTVIAINPNNFEAYGNRAITKNEMHDYLGVIADCNVVLQLNPKDNIARDLKAMAEQKANELYH